MANKAKLIFGRLFSTSAAGVYMILFAIAIGLATFIENDFGTNAAQKVIFKSRWFETLLTLFGISIMVNIFRFKLIQQRKWAIFLFHTSIIVILLGAAATRYLGSEGMMHIREGAESNLILSSDSYLQFEIQKNGKTYHFDEKVLFASLGKNKFKESYQIEDQIIEVQLVDFTPNPVEKIVPGSDGGPIIKVVIAGSDGREEYLIKQGEKKNFNGLPFNFSDSQDPGAINISYSGQVLRFSADHPITQMTMATQMTDTLLPGTSHTLHQRSLYSSAMGNFVITDFLPNAQTTITAGSRKMNKGSQGLVNLNIYAGGEIGNLQLSGSAGSTGPPSSIRLKDMQINAAYGSKYRTLPFAINLRDFIMERYPGTNSASSYASEVTLLDRRHAISQDHRIFMNNILNYDGYRFFQSSYDQDEKGTILSVNHDAIGTWISYLGYFLLTLGMILTLFSKRSRFFQISQKLKELRLKKSIATLMLLSLLCIDVEVVLADNARDSIVAIQAEHAEDFGRVVVQDYRGRMKPFHTLADEVIRKLARKQRLYGQTSEQIFLGMLLGPDKWSDLPLITLGRNPEIKEILHTSAQLVSFNDFFNPEYKLSEQVREAYNMEAKERSTFEKEIIRIDERVNICNMVFTGQLVRLFPSTVTSTDAWLSLADVSHDQAVNFVSGEMIRFFPTYAEAAKNGDWETASLLLANLKQYQDKHGAHLLPSKTKIDAEILLNKLNVFSRVGKWYALLGLLILFMFFTLIFRSNIEAKWPLLTAQTLLSICFLLHTIGLGLRWYVSGRAPWSNGYESMIYIAWTTMLAGLIFTRKSLGGLAATSVLSATILMVAGLSWMDPEITPLVPVLKSYWLTIHVSLEAGSYGFLMLGAIIGVLNLILMIFKNPQNKRRIDAKIRELSLISEMTLIGGLFMISIGTYLGGVWANESWGRYWGWDAKETWALVTILVYAFILHMRFIPGVRGFYAFNVASLFGLASVMMTYFGVNYYLSGLHSYAAGDPVPIPSFVYYTVAILCGISLLAFWKNKQNKLNLQHQKQATASSSL